MAQFCTKCGTPLPEGMQFCTGCGAAIGQPPAPAAQAPAVQAPIAPVPPPSAAPAPYTAPAPVTPVAPPAAKKGSPVLKIVLIVLAVLIFFGLLGAASCVYFVYRVKQKAKQFEKQVQTTFPGGLGTREVRTQPMAPGEVPGAAPAQGTAPIADIASLSYPGAAVTEGESQLNFGLGGVKVQSSTTNDSVDVVTAYYKTKLGSTATVMQSGGSSVVQQAGSNGLLSVTITPDQASGKTKITISSIGKQ